MEHVARTRLIEARKNQHWSQQKVADQIGTTPNNVSRWELGRTTPGPYFRAKLCALFGTSVEELGLMDELIILERSSTPTALVSGETSMRYPTERQGTIWYVPFPRNVLFTGRAELLHHLQAHLNQGCAVALSQPLAISGLGGVGKTQIALEYAYRSAPQYQAVLWMSAETRETLLTDVVAIARLLALPHVEQQAPEQVIESVKQWLLLQERWLLVFDNVEDLGLIQPLLPAGLSGHLLLTTRLQATGTLAHRLDLERMEPEEGVLLLLRRAKLMSADAQVSAVPEALLPLAREICELVDGLPLALDQAGAFIEETGCSLAAYRELYEHHAAALHAWQSQSTPGYPHAVSTTFALSLQQVERILPVAADLLRACAFLHPDAIPEALLPLTAAVPASPLAPLATDPLLLHQALAVLMRQSLLKRHPDAQLLSMHRLVQVVLKEHLDQTTYRFWANQAVEAVNQGFPVVEELTTWQQCQRLLPHALSCLQVIEEEVIVSLAAGRLLQQTGTYLLVQAQYALAERCIRRALHIRTQLLGEEHPQVAESLNTLAELCYFQGAYEQAKALHRQALCMRLRQLGPAHPDVATSLNNLAGVLCMQGEYEAAEPLYEQALHLREQHFGGGHLDVAESLQNLGYLYVQQARYEEAEPLYHHCLRLCERLLEPDHGYLTTIVNNLGTLFLRQGRLTQAEAYYQRALAICQQQFSCEHHQLALIYANLAELACIQGAYRRAKAWQEQALQIREKTLGPAHPRTLESRQKLAELSGEQGNERTSERRPGPSLRIEEQAQDAEGCACAETPPDLVAFRASSGNAQEAELLGQGICSIREPILTGVHPTTSVTQTVSMRRLEQVRRDQQRDDHDLLGKSSGAEPVGKSAWMSGESCVDTSVTPHCPHCSSDTSVVKSGTNRSGTQRFLCRACARSFTPHAHPQGADLVLKEQAVALNAQGKSHRAIARMLGVDHQTVRRWLQAAQTRLEAGNTEKHEKG